MFKKKPSFSVGDICRSYELDSEYDIETESLFIIEGIEKETCSVHYLKSKTRHESDTEVEYDVHYKINKKNILWPTRKTSAIEFIFGD